jgi:integrase
MPVFSANVTTTLHPATVSRLFSSLVDRAELEGVGLHALRHTHATEMLRAGIHPLVVSQRLGHSTVSITLDTYSHVTAGLQEAAALRFEEGLADRSPPPEVAATVT